MNFKLLYCHSHESGNPFFAYFSTVDTRFRGYDIHHLLSCVTLVIKSPYANLRNLRGLAKNAVKIIEKFLIISENLEGFYQMCVTSVINLN